MHFVKHKMCILSHMHNVAILWPTKYETGRLTLSRGVSLAGLLTSRFSQNSRSTSAAMFLLYIQQEHQERDLLRQQVSASVYVFGRQKRECMHAQVTTDITRTHRRTDTFLLS